MLDLDPERRISAEEALKHPFLDVETLSYVPIPVILNMDIKIKSLIDKCKEDVNTLIA